MTAADTREDFIAYPIRRTLDLSRIVRKFRLAGAPASVNGTDGVDVAYAAMVSTSMYHILNIGFIY